jgi:hypothetical protein
MARKNNQVRLKDKEANKLGIEINSSKKYRLSDEHKVELNDLRGGQEVEETTTTKQLLKKDSNDYITEESLFNAWDSKNNRVLDIKEFCIKFNMDFNNISKWKLLPYHYKVPTYNIEFKEQFNVDSVDFESVLNKVLDKVRPSEKYDTTPDEIEFDTLTYTDVHIAMDTDSKGNSMYAVVWDKESIMESLDMMIKHTLKNKKSNTIVVDELGDFLDGFNGYTTRGGHKLPQNMTDEEAFDLGLTFKIKLALALDEHYKKVIFNNICNDNHAGAFGYFVNSAFKRWADTNFSNHIFVNNHRQFMNHYYIGTTCFIITHGKDDSTLKFGFKPQLDSKGLEKIDQYCKHNDIYKKADRVIFKKGDSHQGLFDICTSDDFFYFNYLALSPSSQWVQNNFKQGRRGFVIEHFTETTNSFLPIFL